MVKRVMGKRIMRQPTAEQAAKYRKIRELIAEEWPEIREEALRRKGSRKVELAELGSLLRSERESQGLSLAEIRETTGISKAAISRLENGQNANPTIGTLVRYASALGKQLAVVVTDKVAAE